jgi:hypothetical protein
MPPVLPYAVAAIAALAFISSAEPAPTAAAMPDGAFVRTHVRWGLFATTEPAITTVRFPASQRSDGWTEADSALVSSEGDLPHAITVAEITPCVARALPTDDSASRTQVQWSIDDGAHWHDLTSAPEVASKVEQSGTHPAALTLRYRARAAEGCAMRVVYTAIPAR